ncbi:MAG: tRNA pseudouridine synthase A [Planctomycetes bacterium]|nr:tRNA pseudouridine synthase A [Planctomycetota bacterium]MCW8135321.1 tRNA pseudouridine synthase A [Planctomycetota bacterium]
MRRIVLTLEYHGKGFFGWQRQGPDRSVQAVVEAAVADLAGHPVSVQSAGRTDRGVHARAMPAHVDVDLRLSCRELANAINARLPEDVAVRACREADPRFHARFDALSKTYRYTLLRSKARSPMLADRTHLAPRALDLAAMAAAATLLVGSHDFKSFQTNPDAPEADEDAPEVSADTVGPAAVQHGDFTPPPWRKPRPQGTVRTITRCELLERNELLLIEVSGNGFLRGMVRALTGSLLEVGLGKQPPHWIGGLIDAKDRREAGANLPPQGLTLLGVDYPPQPFEGREAWLPIV